MAFLHVLGKCSCAWIDFRTFDVWAVNGVASIDCSFSDDDGFVSGRGAGGAVPFGIPVDIAIPDGPDDSDRRTADGNLRSIGADSHAHDDRDCCPDVAGSCTYSYACDGCVAEGCADHRCHSGSSNVNGGSGPDVPCCGLCDTAAPATSIVAAVTRTSMTATAAPAVNCAVPAVFALPAMSSVAAAAPIIYGKTWVLEASERFLRRRCRLPLPMGPQHERCRRCRWPHPEASERKRCRHCGWLRSQWWAEASERMRCRRCTWLGSAASRRKRCLGVCVLLPPPL